MLTRRLKPKEVAAEMNCSVATARIRMRQMTHTENPLTVTEDAVERWWKDHTLEASPKAKKTARPYCRHMKMEEDEKFIISRKRPKP